MVTNLWLLIKPYWPPHYPLSLPSVGLADFSVSAISKEAMELALKSFSDPREDLSPSCFKKYLKLEFQFLTHIIAKAMLVKDGTFEKMPKGKVHVKTAIISGTKIN